jgi:hypothetical protein
MVGWTKFRLAGFLGLAGLAMTNGCSAADLSMHGVWRGMIGKYDIMACFDTQTDYSKSAYYYLSQKKIIQLASGREFGNWDEQAGADGKSTAHWSDVKANGSKLAAKWSDGKRKFPIELTRVVLPKDEVETPCGSATFQSPRATPISVTETPADLNGTAYTKLVADVGKQFDVSLESFVLPGETEGIRKVNAQLLQSIPVKAEGSDFLTCMMDSVGSNGMDGEYTSISAPSVITKSFLAVKWSAGSSCGGAHPNFGEGYDVYDLQNGSKFDLGTWFGMAKVLPVLTKLIQARASEIEKDCSEAILQNDYWTYGVEKDGIIFLPDLPHAMQACSTEFTIPFAEMMPLLSAEGLIQVERLRADLE